MVTLEFWLGVTSPTKIKLINDYAIEAGLDDKEKQQVLENLPLLDAFLKEAHKVVRKGHEHYSSRTLIEYLRHHTMMNDSDKVFKINNNMSPILSRISMAMFPQLNGFFNTRTH